MNDSRMSMARRLALAGLLSALALLPGVAQIPAGLPPAPAVEETEAEGLVSLSLDEVDVHTFVKLISEATGLRMVVGEGVTGRIRVISPPVPRRDVKRVFFSILESAGFSVVREGDLYRVVALPERSSLMAPVVGVDDLLPEDGVATKVFRLKHVAVASLRQALEGKVSGGRIGGIGVIEETNHLLVTDTAENLRRVERIILEIDRPGLARVTEVYPLRYAGAEALATELARTLREREPAGDALRQRLPAVEGAPGGGREQAMVVASPHANSLILMGTREQIEEMKRVLALMDVDAPYGKGRLNAIFLKYIGAVEAAASLNALLGNPAKGEAPRPPQRGIAIEASESNNALLVDASPSDFEVVRKLVDQLDQEPQQVHIEVLIAELTVGEGFDLGVDMAAVDLPDGVGDYVMQGASTLGDRSTEVLNTVQQGIFPSGLTLGVASGSRLDAEGNLVVSRPALININAVKRDSRFKVRSNPSLMVQNNREASVNIVNDIPLLTSRVQGTGDSRDVIENIERVEVGIKLKLKPQIMPDGMVRMELNPSIEAVIDQGAEGSGLTPTIARREVQTTVAVSDGDMIVIAGLTQEGQTESIRKMPLLGDIPLLGWLFRRTTRTMERTNVLIFVTPDVVRTPAEAAALRLRLTKEAAMDLGGSDGS